MRHQAERDHLAAADETQTTASKWLAGAVESSVDASKAVLQRPTSRSRQRIRELLDKQHREEDETREMERARQERRQQAFHPNSTRLLWMFR